MQVVTESAEAEQPAMFFCKVGKVGKIASSTAMGSLFDLQLLAKRQHGIPFRASFYISGEWSNDGVAACRSDGVDEIALGGMEKDKVCTCPHLIHSCTPTMKAFLCMTQAQF